MMTSLLINALFLLLCLTMPKAESLPFFRRQSSSSSTALYTHAANVQDPSSANKDVVNSSAHSDEVTESDDDDQGEDNDGNDNNDDTDHSHTYNWPPEQDVMILTHDGIRKELDDMNTVLQNIVMIDDTNSPSPPLQKWQIDAIQKWWKGHQDHVRFHCHNEDDHLHPTMNERTTKFPVDPLRQDHADIYKRLDQMSVLIEDTLTATSGEQQQQQQQQQQLLQLLMDEWGNYRTLLLDHFQQEEIHGVHSTRKAFSAKEWAPIAKQFFDLAAKEEFGALIHAMGVEDFKNVFMKQRKIPGFVWRLSFAKTLHYYETTMWRYMDALLRNESYETE